MNDQSEIRHILGDLKNTGPVYEKLRNGPHPQARTDAASAAATERDVAAVGLAMMELCSLPNQRDLFHQIAHSFGVQPPPNVPLPHDHLRDTAMKLYVQPLLNYVMRQLPDDAQASMSAGTRPIPAPSAAPVGKDPRNVFVIHGRNEAVRKSMFDFLRAIELKPLEWSQVLAATREATPYIGQVLDKAFSIAQAVVVLMTPDDEACLKKEYQSDHDEQFEKQPTGQARPNVLFEAGMAMGRDPKRTVLVQIGDLRPFSDVGGRHVLRLNNSSERRQDLADRLKTAGCLVDLTGRDWHKVGSFGLETPTAAPPEKADAGLNHLNNPQPVVLDEACTDMLTAVADAPDGAWKQDLFARFGLSAVKGEHIFDQLIEHKFIEAIPRITPDGTPFRATPKGRDYLFRKGLL
jgi:predicted nucleotide-binding protein